MGDVQQKILGMKTMTKMDSINDWLDLAEEENTQIFSKRRLLAKMEV